MESLLETKSNGSISSVETVVNDEDTHGEQVAVVARAALESAQQTTGDTGSERLATVTTQNEPGCVFPEFGERRRRTASSKRETSVQDVASGGKRETASAPVGRVTTPVEVVRNVVSAPPTLCQGVFIPEALFDSLEGTGSLEGIQRLIQQGITDEEMNHLIGIHKALNLANEEALIFNFPAVVRRFIEFFDQIRKEDSLKIVDVSIADQHNTITVTISGDYNMAFGFQHHTGAFASEITNAFSPSVSFWEDDEMSYATFKRK